VIGILTLKKGWQS